MLVSVDYFSVFHYLCTDNIDPFNVFFMEAKEFVLDVLKNSVEPLNAGKIAEISGLDRKVVDKAMAALKAEGTIVSPKRCYWTAQK